MNKYTRFLAGKYWLARSVITNADSIRIFPSNLIIPSGHSLQQNPISFLIVAG
jgi:hypothetical protein